jgi:hypothetical protein
MRVNIEYYNGKSEEFSDVEMVFKNTDSFEVDNGEVKLNHGDVIKLNLPSGIKNIPISEIEVMSIDQLDKKEEIAKYKKFTTIAGLDSMIFKQALNGFYYKAKDGNIYWSGNTFIFVGNSFSGHFIKTRNPNGDNSHMFDWDKDEYFKLEDYGKTWSLSEEDLK